MPPRVFRHLARTMVRSQLADRDAVPIRLCEGRTGPVHDTDKAGRPLRAIVQDSTISVQMQDGTVGLVDRTIVTYDSADLPRPPRKGDRVILDGVEHPVGETKLTRVGLVDCYLSG